MTGVFSQPRMIDQALGVLDPKAYGKRFGFKKNAVPVQHSESFPGAMTQGHHHMTAHQPFTIGKLHAPAPARLPTVGR